MADYRRSETASPLLPTTIISQKLVKCRKFANREELPFCYTENSPKEILVLEHVKDYERQFNLIYSYHSHRKFLLYPKNECGIEKFVCTTLRPTQMPFIELYEWGRCADFVANFLEYEELDPPNEFPTVIPSPTNVLEWQYGDSFDLAIVLCSLLLGAGYDAYCVHGKATREITTRDQTQMTCGLKIKEAEMPDTDSLPEASEEEEFPIPIKPPLISEFQKKKNFESEEARRRQEELENTIDDDAPDFLPPDPWKGQRLHCWVLVKEGKRGIETSFFIEPTTGRKYELDDNLYENVEFIWNSNNFWIHMFPNKPATDIDFDLYNGEDWEYVMLDPLGKEKKKTEDNEEEENENAIEDNKIIVDEVDANGMVKEIEHVLDLPPPWAPKLRIDRDVFAKRCPLGEKTVFYERCKVDTYADYTQFDGLVQRVTYYWDYKRQLIKELRCYFGRRYDKLGIKRRFPLEFKTVEDFAPGCPFHWKQIVTIDGYSRLYIYYPTRNTDGLLRREEIFDIKTREYFKGRDDYMIYRSWMIEKRASTTRDYTLGENIVITKMTQKFEKNPNKPAGQKMEKVIYDMKKRKVFVFYHYEPGSIRRDVKEYSRDEFTAIGKVADGQEKEEVDEVFQQELQFIFDMEKTCYAGIKSEENQLRQELDKYNKKQKKWNKLKENNDVNSALGREYIYKSVYDKAREKNKEVVKDKEDEKDQENTTIDYLTPVLKEKGWVNKTLDAKEAREVKNEVMSRLKQRLVHRADIIAKSLEREKKRLQDEINHFARKGDHITPEEQKSYDDFVNEANFRIEILEQRAARHEEQALLKYADMDMLLMNEPILAALHEPLK
jgi:hypothetical protein